MENQNVCYVPKRSGDIDPWIAFGSSQKEYEKWIPHVCGVCCLKMVGDTLHKTNEISLYQLTQMCLQNGAFKVTKSGDIEGVFHYPLSDLTSNLGIYCKVSRYLGEHEIIEHLSNGLFVVLSVDLRKVNPALKGGHLILVHSYNADRNSFTVHDCSSVVCEDGCNAILSCNQLSEISNKRGLLMGKPR